MTLLGRDQQKLEVSCGDFLIQGENLFFGVADGQNNIHVFQYDPESKYFVWWDKTDGRPSIVIWESLDSTS